MLAQTLTLFPLLYLTLELPKRIINDAIDTRQDVIDVWGYDVDQITFLMMLCVAFLLAVIAHGMMKMRINTQKGILAERMLRRFRYTLIHRILRFPQPYIRTTSQGELVSMITSESEPMGGMMGDAISQPILQAGQMITILAFLFAQNALLGAAAIALIPLQAWIIPKLQKRINVHNKERIREVRKLAGEIGETSAGAATIRRHGGWRRRMAIITERLGTLFEIRLQIYKKKFFMKFLNNFITQLTPFFFYSVGGYLVITGDVTLGALVAALAAYKDLSSPWKELLTYYNQMQELSQRWTLIIERFAPEGMFDEDKFEGEPERLPHLNQKIELRDISVRDADGNAILEDLSATIQGGSAVLVAASQDEDRTALTDLLTRESIASSGQILLGEDDIRTLHQRVIAARIGHVDATPYVFDGTFGDNVLTALQIAPGEMDTKKAGHAFDESRRSGNSTDLLSAEWLNPDLAGLQSDDEVLDWWIELVEGLGAGPEVFRRALDQIFDVGRYPELERRLLELRPRIIQATEDAGKGTNFFRFAPDEFNPGISIAGNLFFAKQKGHITDTDISAVREFYEVLEATGLTEDMLRLSQEVVEMLHQTFGDDGTDHPLFRMLGLNAEAFNRKVEVVRKSRKHGGETLDANEIVDVLTLLFETSSEQIGPAFTDERKQTIIDLRGVWTANPDSVLPEHFAPLTPDSCASGLTVLENAIFGKISAFATAKIENLREIVSGILEEAGLKRQMAQLIYDLPTGIGGAQLSSTFLAPLALSRAAIKRPDILVLNGVIGGFDEDRQGDILDNLRRLLPGTTLIILEEKAIHEDFFGQVLELENGRFKTEHVAVTTQTDNAATADLNQKMRALSTTHMFKALPRKQLRLLAFGSKWYEAFKDEYVFRQGDDGSDGAYLILEGEAGIYAPNPEGDDTLIAKAGPGSLVGELALIRKVPRALDMKVHENMRALRLGEQEFLAVVENDAATSFRLMQVIAGYAGSPPPKEDN